MSWLYLGALALSLGGMVLLDRALRLVLWRNAGRALVILGLSVAYFLLWDIAGISAGIFLRGDSPIATGLLLAPELPIEEPIFLFFLSYLTMNLLGLAELVVERVAARRVGEDT